MAKFAAGGEKRLPRGDAIALEFSESGRLDRALEGGLRVIHGQRNLGEALARSGATARVAFDRLLEEEACRFEFAFEQKHFAQLAGNNAGAVRLAGNNNTTGAGKFISRYAAKALELAVLLLGSSQARVP